MSTPPGLRDQKNRSSDWYNSNKEKRSRASRLVAEVGKTPDSMATSLASAVTMDSGPEVAASTPNRNRSGGKFVSAKKAAAALARATKAAGLPLPPTATSAVGTNAALPAAGVGEWHRFYYLYSYFSFCVQSAGPPGTGSRPTAEDLERAAQLPAPAPSPAPVGESCCL
jgi:hypothetical protein